MPASKHGGLGQARPGRRLGFAGPAAALSAALPAPSRWAKGFYARPSDNQGARANPTLPIRGRGAQRLRVGPPFVRPRPRRPAPSLERKTNAASTRGHEGVPKSHAQIVCLCIYLKGWQGSQSPAWVLRGCSSVVPGLHFAPGLVLVQTGGPRAGCSGPPKLLKAALRAIVRPVHAFRDQCKGARCCAAPPLARVQLFLALRHQTCAQRRASHQERRRTPRARLHGPRSGRRRAR